MAKKQTLWAMFVLVLLTLAGLASVYQMLFAVWMTAYPYANTSEWRARLYVRLAITIVLGLVWTVLAIWIFRQRRKSKFTGSNLTAAD
jgi:hypothetical protein